MTTDMSPSIRASRYRVPRTRGAMSGFVLLILGAWAGIVPFIGPYINLAFTPAPNTAWHWTSARGWFDVAPGAAAFLGGLLLLFSASRVVTMFGGWLAAAGGAWLIVGPPLAGWLGVNLGTPDPTSSPGVQALTWLLFFYAIGAAILLVAGMALGRLSVRTLRDVRAAERRVAEEQAVAGAPAAGERGDYRGERGDYRGDAGDRPGATASGEGTSGTYDQRYAHTAPPPPPPEEGSQPQR